MNPVKIIDLEGMVNLNDPTHTERNANFRKQFSTPGYFNDENTNWNHKNFDMFGFGKTLQQIVNASSIYEAKAHTVYD